MSMSGLDFLLGYSEVLLWFLPDSQNSKEQRSKEAFIEKKEEGREEEDVKEKRCPLPRFTRPFAFRIYSHNNEYFIKALS